MNPGTALSAASPRAAFIRPEAGCTSFDTPGMFSRSPHTSSETPRLRPAPAHGLRRLRPSPYAAALRAFRFNRSRRKTDQSMAESIAETTDGVIQWGSMEPAATATTHNILLVVLNARYSHPALGVRCLLANMGNLRSETALEEFLIGDDPQLILENILRHRPQVVGFSLSIWNVQPTSRVMALLRRVAPEIRIIAGGPEVRWAQEPPLHVDTVIRGEGETVFPELCKSFLNGDTPPPVVDGGLPNLEELNLPYNEYTDEDLSRRITYVETARGCPFGCEFCLSSRETHVREFSLERMLPVFDNLLERGCRTFKFIDRTFNRNLRSCEQLLDFFYSRWPRDAHGNLIGPGSGRQMDKSAENRTGLFLHFEVVPDRFDERIVESLARFPAGGVQLEVGVQTLDPEAGERIGRRINVSATRRSLSLLSGKTEVHIHADLIAGLPGEDAEDFERSFNGLREMCPGEIQLGILKLLPGAPLARHVEPYKMVFNPEPPYDVLQTDRIPFERMQELKRLARYYEMFSNSGKFFRGMQELMDGESSAFAAFDAFSAWLWKRFGRAHAIGLPKQYEALHDYLSTERNLGTRRAGILLAADYLSTARERYMPERLRPFSEEAKETLQKGA